MNSSDNVLPASSWGRVSQVKGMQHVYSIGADPQRRSVSVRLCPPARLFCSHALPDPRTQGCPIRMPGEKDVKAQYQEDEDCNMGSANIIRQQQDVSLWLNNVNSPVISPLILFSFSNGLSV